MCEQVKSPAYVGIAYALKRGDVGAKRLAAYVKNVVLKGETSEVVATMPHLAGKLQTLNKVYDAYIAELMAEAAHLQREFQYEEGKCKKAKWARACQSKAKFLCQPLMLCCFDLDPDAAWFRTTLLQLYSRKDIGGVIEQLVSSYASKAESDALMSELFINAEGG